MADDILEKYKELFTYSTDVLLREHDRFTKADGKASKYSTNFVFLLGIFAYTAKRLFDRFPWRALTTFSPHWPAFALTASVIFATVVLGAIAIAAGWLLSNQVIQVAPIVSRPLNDDVVAFYDAQPLLNIYDSFARANVAAYQENKASTDKKYAILSWAHRMMILSVLLLIAMLGLCGLCSLLL